MRRGDRAAVGALTLLAAALRFATLDLQSFWFDEALTATLLRRDLGGLIDGVHDTQLTPHAYYLLAWAWTQLFGTGEVGLRSLSAVLGTALVPLAYVLGRSAYSRRAGLMLAAFAATSPLLLFYSQEARPYGLFVLLGALGLLPFLRLARGEWSRALLAAWTAASALALATHYFAVFLIAPQLVLLAVRAPRRREVAAAGAVLAATGLALAPLALFQRGNIGTGYITGYPLADRLGWLLRDALAGVAFHQPDGSSVDDLLTVAALPAIGIAAWALWRRAEPAGRRAAVVPVVLGAAMLGGAVVLAVAGLDYVNPRNMLQLWLPAFLALAIALAAWRGGPWGAVAAAWVCLVGLAGWTWSQLEERRHRSDWRSVAGALGPPPPGGRIVAMGPIDGEVTLGYYLPRLRPLPAGGAPVRELALVAVRAPGTGPDAAAARRPPPAPAPGFAFSRAEAGPGHLVLRYRARRAVSISPGDLDEAVPWLARPALRIQRPSAGGG